MIDLKKKYSYTQIHNSTSPSNTHYHNRLGWFLSLAGSHLLLEEVDLLWKKNERVIHFNDRIRLSPVFITFKTHFFICKWMVYSLTLISLYLNRSFCSVGNEALTIVILFSKPQGTRIQVDNVKLQLIDLCWAVKTQSTQNMRNKNKLHIYLICFFTF